MTIQWMHFDALNSAWLDPSVPALCVIDDDYLEHHGWGLKRLAFVYETLLEIPGVEIHRGSTLDFLSRYSRVATVDSPDPWLRRQFEALRTARVELIVNPAPPFVDLPAHTDLRRFARYWKKAEPRLFAGRA